MTVTWVYFLIVDWLVNTKFVLQRFATRVQPRYVDQLIREELLVKLFNMHDSSVNGTLEKESDRWLVVNSRLIFASFFLVGMAPFLFSLLV